ERQRQVRTSLAQHLEEPARNSLKGVPLEDLDQLSPEHLQRAGEMIASGKFDEKVGAELYAAAKAKSPGLSEQDFQKGLRGAVESVTAGRELEKAATVKRREVVLGSVPDEGRAALAGLDDEGIKVVKQLMESGAKGSPMLREELFRAAAKDNPALEK